MLRARVFARAHLAAVPAPRARLASSAPPPADPDPQVSRSWVDSPALPRALVPYLRLARVDRPAGTLLVLLPAWAGAALGGAPGAAPDAALLCALGAGAFFVRGAGCAVNDAWDARFDAAVARTRARPVAAGALSRGAALGAAAALLLAGAAAAAAADLNASAAAAAAAAVPLVALYPAAKRVVAAPQAVLGATMNWGVIVGAAAARGGASGRATDRARALWAPRAPPRAAAAVLDAADAAAAGWARACGAARAAAAPAPAPALGAGALLAAPFGAAAVRGAGGARDARDAAAPLFLFAGCALWTVVYDTIYAHQDRRDDARLGLRSSALWIGPARSRAVLGALAGGAVAAWAAAGAAAGLAWPWAAAVAAAAAHLAWQVRTADWDCAASLTRRFVANHHVGALLVAGALGGRALSKPEAGGE